VSSTKKKVFKARLYSDRAIKTTDYLNNKLSSKKEQLAVSVDDNEKKEIEEEIKLLRIDYEKCEKLSREAKEAVDKRSHYLEDAKSKCWEESLLRYYSSITDYTAVIVQLSIVLSFSMVFPLAPLLALVYNLALIRFDALKLCYTRQRPIAVKTSGIGVWEDVLQIMSVFGVLTNCAIMGITSNQLSIHFNQYGPAGIVILLFLLEHLILFFKYWLYTSVSRIPPSILKSQERDRKSVCRRQTNKKTNKNKMKKDSMHYNSDPLKKLSNDIWSPDFTDLGEGKEYDNEEVAYFDEDEEEEEKYNKSEFDEMNKDKDYPIGFNQYQDENDSNEMDDDDDDDDRYNNNNNNNRSEITSQSSVEFNALDLRRPSFININMDYNLHNDENDNDKDVDVDDLKKKDENENNDNNNNNNNNNDNSNKCNNYRATGGSAAARLSKGHVETKSSPLSMSSLEDHYDDENDDINKKNDQIDNKGSGHYKIKYVDDDDDDDDTTSTSSSSTRSSASSRLVYLFQIL
jgi:hypothetical protein